MLNSNTYVKDIVGENVSRRDEVSRALVAANYVSSKGRSHNLMLIGKNKRKMGKKAMCLIFAFLLSINSFAAVVSDNDGAAFVTKAEFEALKKNFADQIDNYNISIDSKIDGAIASYLAGIRLSRKEVLKDYVTQMQDIDINSTYFYKYNSTLPWGSTNNDFYGKFSCWIGVVQLNNTNPNKYWQFRAAVDQSYGGPTSWYEYGDKNAFFFFYTNDQIKDASGIDGSSIVLKERWKYSNQIAWKMYGAEAHHNAGTFPTTIADWNSGLNTSPVFEYPNQNKEAGVFKNMSEWDIKWSNKVLELTGALSDNFVRYSGTEHNTPIGRMSSNKIPNESIYCISYVNRSLYDGNLQTIVAPECPGTGAGNRDSAICRRYYVKNPGSTGWTQVLNDVGDEGTFRPTYKFYDHKYYNIALNKFTNEVASNMLSKPVYLYNGLPLTEIDRGGMITIRCKLYNIDNPSNKVKIYILDREFKNEDSPIEDKYEEGGTILDHVLHRATYDANTDLEITIDMSEYPNKEKILWYRLEDETGAAGRIYMKVESIMGTLGS